MIDAGTAATTIPELRPSVGAHLNKNPDRDYPSGIAYVGKSKPRLLIIGSGGGEQVLDGLHYGAASITAVEINPITTRIVSQDMNDFCGGLFRQPGVQLITEEGRSFVRRSQERYDAIISVHTISNAAIASGALSLAENYVLTREAFEDYLDHLEGDGVHFIHAAGNTDRPAVRYRSGGVQQPRRARFPRSCSHIAKSLFPVRTSEDQPSAQVSC